MTGRGKSEKSLRIIAAAREILEEIQPASVRAVCYRLFTRGLISEMSKGQTNKVSKQLVYAREHGIIPWRWIVDETRSAEYSGTWDNPEQIINSTVTSYRRDYWQDQEEWVEVWSEKGTVRGTIARILRDYGVTFRVMHGYSSATTLQGVARDTDYSEKPLSILYVGDWDPSGLHMSEVDIPERLVERYRGFASVRRIALTAADVAAGDLPSFDADTKRGDGRYEWFVRQHGYECVELDAMSPNVLRTVVEEAICEYIDMDKWNRAKEVEAAEIESMRDIMTMWKQRLQK